MKNKGRFQTIVCYTSILSWAIIIIFFLIVAPDIPENSTVVAIEKESLGLLGKIFPIIMFLGIICTLINFFSMLADSFKFKKWGWFFLMLLILGFLGSWLYFFVVYRKKSPKLPDVVDVTYQIQ